MKNAVYPLFACPIMISGARYDFARAEESFLGGLEMIDNVGNAMSKDDTVLDRPEMSKLRRFVEEQIDLFAKNLLRLPADNDIYITQSWVTLTRQGEHHPKHRHPNSIISGVMYLDDAGEETQSPIRFHRSNELFPLDFAFDDLNEFNASSREFDPERGMLVMFPSLLEHDVGTNRSALPRRSLSFNTFVRGSIGGREQLTRLEVS